MKMKRFVATTLAVAMAVSSTVSAAEWNTEGGESTVVGDSSVVQPVIEVALPGDLAFMIDPYMVTYESQIIGGDYNVVNYSNVAVEVKVQPSIVHYEELNEDGSVAADLNVLEIPATAPTPTTVPTADGGTKDVYTDISSTVAADPADQKKAVYLIAIPADTAGALADTNGDGIYEFAYTTDANNIGRGADATTGLGTDAEAFTYGTPAVGNDTAGVAYKLSLKKYDEVDPAAAFTFVLGKEDGVTDPDTEVYTPAVSSVASFTVGGAVDTKAALVDGDVQIQAVYELATLSKNEKAAIDAGGTNSGDKSISGTKHQLEVVAP